MIEVFKLMNNLYDNGVTLNLTKSGDVRTRGNSFKLITNRCKYDIRKYSFSNRVTKIWNGLPDSVILSDTINVFKNKLDKLWNNDNMRFDPKFDF